MKAVKITFGLLLAALIVAGCNNGNKPREANNFDTFKNSSKKSSVDTTNSTVASAKTEENGQSLTAESGDLNSTESEFQIVVNLSADVLFDFNKADVKPAAELELSKLAATIKQKGKGVTKITGFTDAKGDDAYNQQLSERRAVAIATWLKGHGLSDAVFTTAGEGEKAPVAPNTNADGSDNPDGRAKNRRVEIVINKTNTLGK